MGLSFIDKKDVQGMRINSFWFERMFRNVKLKPGDTVFEVTKPDFTKPVYEYKNKFYVIEKEVKK